MAAIMLPRAGAVNTAHADAPSRDFETLRFATRLARATDCAAVFAATSPETVTALDPTFASALKKGVASSGGRIGVLIKCPVDADEAVAALHFASLCSAQGAKLALELPETLCATSWVVARAMAGAIDASAILITGRTIVKMYADGRAGGAREMVATLVRPGAALIATAIDGPALETLCKRAGASGFEFGKSRPPATEAPGVGAVSTSGKLTAVPTGRGSIAGLVAVATLSLAACSSVPRPAVPDGSTRVPVNDPARLAIVEQYARLQDGAIAQREEVASLRQQVQELRTAVKVLAVVPQLEVTRPAGIQSAVLPPSAPVLGSAIALTATADSRSVEATKDGLVFRVFHPSGGSNFAPSGKFAEALRAAIAAGSAIEVRGFTDSPIDDGPNRRVAVARAGDARQWLLEQGVDPKLIKCKSTSHGHFLADNGTSAGRALNRRVEVEIRGDTTQAVAILNRKEG